MPGRPPRVVRADTRALDLDQIDEKYTWRFWGEALLSHSFSRPLLSLSLSLALSLSLSLSLALLQENAIYYQS